MADGNTEIVANIKKINKEVSNLADNSKRAASDAQLLSQAFKMGVGGHTTTEVFESYETAIQKTQKSIDQYNDSIRKLKEEQDKLNKDSKDYADAYTKFDKAITNSQNAVRRLQNQLIELQIAQKDYTEEAIKEAEATKKAEEEAKKLARNKEILKLRNESLNKVLRTSIAVVTALVATYKKWITSSVQQAQELYGLSKRYGATVEEIQDMNRALQLATGQSDLFTQSLSVLAQGMSDIAGNRGQKYTAALREVGTSYKELSALSKSEQFSTIVEGLLAIENESERAAHAQTLLGESGQYIVGAFANGKYSLDEYIKSAQEYGKITTESAEKLTFLGFKIDAVKSKINEQIAQIVVDAEPVIMSVLNVLKSFIPLISTLSKNSWILWAAISAIIALKLASTIIAWRIKFAELSVSIGTATAKAAIFNVVVGGLATAVIGIGAIMASTALSAKNMRDSIADSVDTANRLGEQSGEFNANVNTYANSNTEHRLVVDMNVRSEGNTPISDETAEKIAQITTEKVNRELGMIVGKYVS